MLARAAHHALAAKAQRLQRPRRSRRPPLRRPFYPRRSPQLPRPLIYACSTRRVTRPTLRHRQRPPATPARKNASLHQRPLLPRQLMRHARHAAAAALAKIPRSESASRSKSTPRPPPTAPSARDAAAPAISPSPDWSSQPASSTPPSRTRHINSRSHVTNCSRSSKSNRCCAIRPSIHPNEWRNPSKVGCLRRVAVGWVDNITCKLISHRNFVQ